MAQHLRIANTGVVHRQVGEWAETETAQDIRRSLEMVWTADRPSMTMIAGGPGIGKTTAIRHFCDSLGHDAIYIQAARGEGTAWNFAHALANLWGHFRPTFNCLSEARDKIAQIIGGSSVLVVDEAQYLHQRNGKTGQTGEAFEWVRAAADTAGFDVVFCGDLNLPNAINAMPQLRSRMMRPVVIKQVSKADVAAIVEGTPFATRKAIDVLFLIAKLHGGLRNVENVIRLASLFAGNGYPGIEHLTAAIEDMKLSPKGGM